MHLIVKYFTKFDFYVISLPHPPRSILGNQKIMPLNIWPKKEETKIYILYQTIYIHLICINSTLVPKKSKTYHIVSSINASMMPFFNEVNIEYQPTLYLIMLHKHGI